MTRQEFKKLFGECPFKMVAQGQVFVDPDVLCIEHPMAYYRNRPWTVADEMLIVHGSISKESLNNIEKINYRLYKDLVSDTYNLSKIQCVIHDVIRGEYFIFYRYRTITIDNECPTMMVGQNQTHDSDSDNLYIQHQFTK